MICARPYRRLCNRRSSKSCLKSRRSLLAKAPIAFEQLFAEHIWKDVLNKSDDTDYQEFWEKELAQSFLVVRTQDNAYFLKRNHG